MINNLSYPRWIFGGLQSFFWATDTLLLDLCLCLPKISNKGSSVACMLHRLCAWQPSRFWSTYVQSLLELEPWDGVCGKVHNLGFIYIRAKANAKATSLLTCCIVSDLCIYTTATAVVANIKEKYRFRVRFRSNINESLNRIPFIVASRCAFSATGTTNHTVRISDSPIVFPAVNLNTCGGYDAKTGKQKHVFQR